MFGRKPKENALREIQNLLTQKSFDDLTAADLENVLSDYELPRTEALEGLRHLYRSALDFRVTKDLRLSDEDIADLHRLRYVVGLEDSDAKNIELDLPRELYRGLLRHALIDGQLADAEKAELEGMAANFA